MLIKPKQDIHRPLSDGRTLPYVGQELKYVVVALTTGNYMIVADPGEPVLVPSDRFEVIDSWIPFDWVRQESADGSWFGVTPREFSARGFFERWHDGCREERAIFARVCLSLWKHYEEELAGQAMILKVF